jgi:large subunit ribosomal protein L10
MATKEKIAEVQAIADRMEKAQSIILANYSGLSVEQMTIFRSTCRANAIDCRVVKNRLAKIACDNADKADMKDYFKGPTAILFGMESQVEAAKILVDFAKDNENMGIKGGIVDGQLLSPDQVVALSKVPSKDELYAMMMGSINSPLTGIAMCTNGVAAGLARCIDAVAKQKAEQAA